MKTSLSPLSFVQVWRVAMLALRNLLTNAKLELGPDMVEAGLPKVVQQRLTQVHTLARHIHSLPPHVIANGLSSSATCSHGCLLLCHAICGGTNSILTYSASQQQRKNVQHELVLLAWQVACLSCGTIFLLTRTLL